MRIRWGLGIAVAVGLITCGYYLTWDWNKSLLGFHAFRQTQTAITAYWFIHEGFTLDYQTPVLGKPWAIPYEFPLYQAIAALASKIAEIDLDQAGRSVSVLFWIACLFPLERILHWWVQDRVLRWTVILLISSSPTYIYWSDSFMMESTALFFSLLYIYYQLRSIREASRYLALLAIACALMAGLQKATTLLIALVPGVAFAGMELYRRPIDRHFWKHAVMVFLGVALPVAAIEVWTRHTDVLKALNTLARDFNTSQALMTWNFGTVSQRESLDVWNRIGTIETEWGLGHGSSWLLLAAVLTLPVAIWRGPYRMEILVLIAAYLAGPLLFTNLIAIHAYYNYEISLYLELAFALALIGLVEPLNFHPKVKLTACCGIMLAMSVRGIFTYHDQVIPEISARQSSVEVRQLLSPLAQAGNPQDILLTYGLDWNPGLSYYSGRKAIMVPDSLSVNDPKIDESLARLSSDQTIAAMIVRGPLNQNTSFIQERVQRFHLQSTPITLPWGQCYLKAP